MPRGGRTLHGFFCLSIPFIDYFFPPPPGVFLWTPWLISAGGDGHGGCQAGQGTWEVSPSQVAQCGHAVPRHPRELAEPEMLV